MNEADRTTCLQYLEHQSIKRPSKHLPSDCWCFEGSNASGGYGRVSKEIKSLAGEELAHRVAIVATGRQFTTERPFALHKCDNRKCCNPQHLEIGNAAENKADDKNFGKQIGNGKGYLPKSHYKKGHQRTVGANNGRATLTEDQVRDIKRKLQSGDKPRTIAEAMGTTITIVRNIKVGLTWKHI